MSSSVRDLWMQRLSKLHAPGAIPCIVAQGCGKSTLLSVLSGRSSSGNRLSSMSRSHVRCRVAGAHNLKTKSSIAETD
eukprot:4126848-Amphidinium_carterae.2